MVEGQYTCHNGCYSETLNQSIEVMFQLLNIAQRQRMESGRSEGGLGGRPQRGKNIQMSLVGGGVIAPPGHSAFCQG